MVPQKKKKKIHQGTQTFVINGLKVEYEKNVGTFTVTPKQVPASMANHKRLMIRLL